MNERIKKLRKALDLTQREFGERIGVKPNTVATYEIGRNQPIDAVVSLVCREFNVNETWLRTGEGEMFNKPPETLADKLAQEYGLDDLGRQIMAAYLGLSESDRLAVGRLVQNLIDERADNLPPWTEEEHAAWEAEARAEAEQVYQQVLQEKKAEAGYSASPPDLLA